MTKTAEEFRAEAAAALTRKEESFERCDTDGFVSQWAGDLTAQLAIAKAEITENGGQAQFLGLFLGDRRVKARVIHSRFGASWLLHEDEAELIEARGKQFLPTGPRSRILKSLGLREAPELAPAWAHLRGNGTGLAGAHTVHVHVFRTGDKWGQDATLAEEV